MEQRTVNIPKLILVTLIYTVFIVLGFFTQIEAVLFPVFAVPFAIYVAKNKPPIAVQSIFHVVMLMMNYFISDYNVAAILIYCVSVAIIAYIILFFYEQHLALPNFIMYVAISLCVVVFIFFSIMKLKGIDFEQTYTNCLDSMKILFDETTKKVISLQGSSSTVTNEYVAALTERQKVISETLEQMKAYYAYTVVTLVYSFSGIAILIFNAILRRNNKQLPSIKELIEFRLSKAAVLVFIISMIVVSMTGSSQDAMIVLGLNLMNVFIWLFRLAGGLGLIGLLNRSGANSTLKVLGYIGIAVAFTAGPFILSIYGCLDALFNFRKVEIVV